MKNTEFDILVLKSIELISKYEAVAPSLLMRRLGISLKEEKTIFNKLRHFDFISKPYHSTICKVNKKKIDQ